MNLFENMESSNRADEIKPLINKWGKTGLLEGLSTQYKATVASMLEMQAKQLIKEGSATSAGVATGGTGYEQWHGVALPLVRRVFAQIAAKEFVSVQPMNLPSGLVFYLDYKYGTNKTPFGFDPTGKNQTGTLQGVTSTVGADASDGLYGAGRFGYSISSSLGSATTAAAATSVAGDVNYDGIFTASIAQYKTVVVPLPADADIYAVRSFGLVSSSTAITSAQIYPNFTKVSAGVAGYTASFVVTGSSVTVAAPSVQVVYSKQPTNDGNRGDFEAKPVSSTNRYMDTDLNIPEIELQMRSISLTAKTRKLKASWTPEFAQDLNAYHSVDAEAELTSMLSEYVSMEIDLEILDMLINAAATTDYWSARTNQIWNPTTNAFAQDPNVTGNAYIQGTWYSTLGTKLQKVSNQIHAKTLRGGANFLVCSPTVATILESIPGYAADGDGTKMTYNMGVQKVGALTGRYTVYKNPYMTENTILMGFRGNQFLETGAVYAPYIPLMLTPLVYDPANFTPRRGVMTRYAKVVTRPEFYGKVYVGDLNFV